MKLKGRKSCFHFSINIDGNLVVSFQMHKTLNFIDLYEKEESRSIFLTLHKRDIRKIFVRVLESKSAEKKITSIQLLSKNRRNAINVCTDFIKVYCDNIMSEINNSGGYFQCCSSL